MNQIQPPTSQEEGSRGDTGKARTPQGRVEGEAGRSNRAPGPLGRGRAVGTAGVWPWVVG